MSRLLVADDAGKPVVEIFADDETGHSSARCMACPWAEDRRGRLPETVWCAKNHVDSNHPGGTP